MASGKLNSGLNVIGVAGDHDAQRLDLILARVSAIEHAAVAVEPYFAVNDLLQFVNKLACFLE